MTAEDIGKSFVQEFVLSFGLLSGLWINAGVDPEAELIKAMSIIVQQIAPNPLYSLIFWIIPLFGTIVSLLLSFRLGGLVGLIAVGFAFLGGVFINSGFGVFLIFVGVVLGLIAPSTID